MWCMMRTVAKHVNCLPLFHTSLGETVVFQGAKTLEFTGQNR